MTVHAADWNGLDWVLGGVVLLSTVRGLMRGLVRALFSLLGFVGGFEVASWNYVAAADWMNRRQMIASAATARIVAFLALVAAVIVVFELIGRLVKKTAHSVGLGMFDRMLGGVFGLARGVLFGAALILAITAISPDASWVKGSRSSSYFLAAAHTVSFVVPRGLR